MFEFLVELRAWTTAAKAAFYYYVKRGSKDPLPWPKGQGFHPSKSKDALSGYDSLTLKAQKLRWDFPIVVVAPVLPAA